MAQESDPVIPRKYYTHTTPFFTNSDGREILILEWTFTSFSGLANDQDYHFPPVRPSSKCDLRVSFYRYKNGISTFLYIENKVENLINLSATTTIYGSKGEKLYSEVVNNITLKEKTDIIPNFRESKHLSKPLPNLVPIIFHIKLEMFNTTLNEELPESKSEMKLLEDMKNFILADHPAKVILKNEDVEISANKAILRARSSVFQKMFDHPTSEQEKNVIQVDDVTGATLKTLVDFLYYGKAELPDSDLPSLQELYYASDKYDVLDLREMCAQAMVRMLKEENVIGVLLLADRHSDQFLKNKCLVFMRSCIKPLMGTESWTNLKVSDPGLAFEVLETCLCAALQQKSE